MFSLIEKTKCSWVLILCCLSSDPGTFLACCFSNSQLPVWMFCWCLFLEGSPNTGKITFLSKSPGYQTLAQGYCSPLLEVKRVSTRCPKILQAKGKQDGPQRHSWIGAPMSPHSCCASWLSSLPPHLWQSPLGLSWGAKSKHVSIVCVTIIQSVQ